MDALPSPNGSHRFRELLARVGASLTREVAAFQDLAAAQFSELNKARTAFLGTGGSFQDFAQLRALLARVGLLQRTFDLLQEAVDGGIDRCVRVVDVEILGWTRPATQSLIKDALLCILLSTPELRENRKTVHELFAELVACVICADPKQLREPHVRGMKALLTHCCGGRVESSAAAVRLVVHTALHEPLRGADLEVAGSWMGWLLSELSHDQRVLEEHIPGLLCRGRAGLVASN
jgi:hypothetical protein